MGTHSEPGGARTLGHRIKSPMLYQLSYWLNSNHRISRIEKKIKSKVSIKRHIVVVENNFYLVGGFIQRGVCGIASTMVWIILFIPVCVWLSMNIVSQLNLLTLGGVALTCVIFFLIELTQVSHDGDRSKRPLWVMFLMLVTLSSSVFF